MPHLTSILPTSLLRCVHGYATAVWLLLTLVVGHPVAAKLQPDEIAVLAVLSSPRSQELASYYAKTRQLPEDRICLIDVPPGKPLSRSDWETKIRPAIRQWVWVNGLEGQLRCWVTTWDVPLKIGKLADDDPRIRDRKVYLAAERSHRVARFSQTFDQVRDLIEADKAPLPPSFAADAELETILDAFRKFVSEAQQSIHQAELPTDESRQRQTTLQQLVLQGAGLQALAHALRSSSSETDEQDTDVDGRIQALAGRLFGLREGQAALEELVPSVQRDEKILSLLERGAGLAGSLAWVDEQLDVLEKNQSHASFDSELSLLFWPQYPLQRWQPNVLHHRFDGSHERELKATLMVSRLEAPTWDLSKGLIDTALQVETEGLQGKVYLDARGIGKIGKPAATGSYAHYDTSLLRLARDLRDHTQLDVGLDTDNQLFQSGACPQAAVYCGWYGRANHANAFEWVPGAVGYHMISDAAVALRSRRGGSWCQQMLADGICATMGPVHEPYLTSFPLPEEFFPLLLSGRYTLAEAYYRSKLYNSWVMVLIGDPLYQPFGGSQMFDNEQAPQAWKSLVLETAQ